VDVNCGSNPPYYTQHLYAAMLAGAVSKADIDRAVSRYWRLPPLTPSPLFLLLFATRLFRSPLFQICLHWVCLVPLSAHSSQLLVTVTAIGAHSAHGCNFATPRIESTAAT